MEKGGWEVRILVEEMDGGKKNRKVGGGRDERVTKIKKLKRGRDR